MEKKLTSQEQDILLKLARESITEAVTRGAIGTKKIPNGNLHSRCGCFVTIKIRDRLRGCIGTFSTGKPLYAAVQEMAAAAATQDPRFYPLTPEELDEIRIEISVLSPLKKISSTEEIKVGIHGLYIEKGLSRGVLLPQVATEYGWDRETFLAQTCLKAGLEPDAWEKDADISIFTAQIFGEK